MAAVGLRARSPARAPESHSDPPEPEQEEQRSSQPEEPWSPEQASHLQEPALQGLP